MTRVQKNNYIGRNSDVPWIGLAQTFLNRNARLKTTMLYPLPVNLGFKNSFINAMPHRNG